MLSEDFTAFAGRVHVRFREAKGPEDVKRLVAENISGIAKECVKAGTRLIGHIKCIAEVESGKYIACSVVSHDTPATCRGEIEGSSRTLDLILNVLIYGLDKEKVEGIVVKESRRVFAPSIGEVRFENLEFIETGHECDEDHHHEHGH